MKTKYTTYTAEQDSPVWVSTSTLEEENYIYTFIRNE